MYKKSEHDIDFVITWVNGTDPAWVQEKKKYNPTIHMDDSTVRYRDWGTLKYLLRSIEKFAPWVRSVFLVTNGQVPQWLNLECKKLKLVKHSDFIPEEYLSTFNPQTIEWHLHKIEGLSENFVYFNDDVILTNHVQPTDFFENGLPKDTFGLGMVRPTELFSRIAFNNICVLNKHFAFKETLKKNRNKFFRLNYGQRLWKSLILSKQKCFYGMYDPHITLSFKKTYFDLLWKTEQKLIEDTCKNKFRSQNDITIWLVRYWQLLKGDFIPRSVNFGRIYSIHQFVQNKNSKKELKKGKYKVLCVNDSEKSDVEFGYEKNRFNDIMNTILCEKSCFEK